ncbi:MAG: hypothetical protein AAGI34_03090 [Pseudomonadota bacterium]
MIDTRFIARALVILAFCVLFAQPVRAQIILEGRYLGQGPAAGAQLEIAPDPGGFEGRFIDAEGQAQEFLAERRGDLAIAVLDLGGQVVLMQAAPLPFGAEVALVPVDAEGARPEDGQLLTFHREGVRNPEWPRGFLVPPEPGAPFAANAFLVSYRWWKPNEIARGYMALAPRHRTLFRLFPEVQLDLIWKLCLANGADGAVAAALRGQPLSCQSAMQRLARIQERGRYAAYREAVEGAAETLRTSVRCADNYVMAPGACERVAGEVARASVSLETTATVLGRYD